VGQEVELTLTFARPKKALLLSARVARRIDEGESRRYGFQFTDRQQLEQQLRPTLYRLFNRRASYRVRPAPDHPVEVTLECFPGGTPVQAQLIDISTGGMALRVPLEAESALADSDRVRVSASLPDCPQRLDLSAIICSRSLAGAEIRYGVKFDLQRTDSSQCQQDAILNFVMARQRAELHAKQGE
jgi:c-di-GMP-binding flagellar brake protein YcgR